jgi:hypothetical protein
MNDSWTERFQREGNLTQVLFKLNRNAEKEMTPYPSSGGAFAVVSRFRQ